MPIYETDADKTKEEIIAAIFCKRFKYNCIPAPAMARWDFCITKPTLFKGTWLNVVQGIAEVKVRSCKVGAYPTMMIDADKISYLRNHTSDKVKGLLIVAWVDAIGWIDIAEKSFLSTGGRFDRQDPNDHKMVLHYPIEKFNLIVDKRKKKAEQ